MLSVAEKPVLRGGSPRPRGGDPEARGDGAGVSPGSPLRLQTLRAAGRGPCARCEAFRTSPASGIRGAFASCFAKSCARTPRRCRSTSIISGWPATSVDIDAERPRARRRARSAQRRRATSSSYSASQKRARRSSSHRPSGKRARSSRRTRFAASTRWSPSLQGSARHFDSLAGIRAEVVPMVMAFERKARPAPSKPNLCYVGNLRWHPNVAGLDWFCRKVWPLVRARVPDATFEIAGVGLKPDASGALPVPEAWKVPGVQTIGFMEDLEPLYQRSLGMLAPVFGGSGVRGRCSKASVHACRHHARRRRFAPRRRSRDAHRRRRAGLRRSGRASRARRIASRTSPRGGYRYLEEHHSLAVAQRVMRRVLGVNVMRYFGQSGSVPM